MTMPIPSADFARAESGCSANIGDGLAGAIDAVAGRAPPSHRFLRYGWFAAAITAYGGHSRTLVVTEGQAPVLALPMVAVGPTWLRMASIPGSYWPFRSFPVAEGSGPRVFDAALNILARQITALRIGPVYDGDVAVAPLLERARASGWAVLDRLVADSFLLDIVAVQAEGPWPRGSTLKKNRFHEKHLAAHGALDWRFVSGGEWTDAAFTALADIERASWIADRTDGGDAKFTDGGHGAFWRAAAADPEIARMMSAAVLEVGGRPAAFSFDMNVGATKYAIANSYVPDFAKHSPGKLLYYRNLVRAIEDGITAVDWGAGDSGYKRTIGAAQGPAIRDWLIVRPGAAAAAARLLVGWWRRSGK